MPDDSRVYDVVAFEELEFDEDEQLYTYQCPCGYLFEITQDEFDTAHSQMPELLVAALGVNAGRRPVWR